MQITARLDQVIALRRHSVFEQAYKINGSSTWEGESMVPLQIIVENPREFCAVGYMGYGYKKWTKHNLWGKDEERKI